MNGVPHMGVMRSISLYGLSDIKLTFEDSTNEYFARQVVFERLAQATLPTGVTPALAPLFSPSGLVYRYVLESPDRSPQELKTIEDWVVARAYRSVPGVADVTVDPDSGWINFGTYRVMVHDRSHCGLYVSPGTHGCLHRDKYSAQGKPMPVLAIVGIAPTLLLAS